MRYPDCRAILPVVALTMFLSVVPVSYPAAGATTSVTPRKIVVFLEGVCSSIPAPPGRNVFDDLRDILEEPRYGYGEADFIQYSYAGGKVEGGNWYPNSYSEMVPITQDFQTTSWSRLHNDLLVPYRKAHPEATFTLVGHSLGGVVAFEEVVKYVDSPDYQPGFLSTVITIDSPLHGATPTMLTAGGIFGDFFDVPPCTFQGPSTATLVGIHNDEPQTTKTLQEKVKRAHEKGVVVANVGNTFDCLWEFARCLPKGSINVGDSETQWIFDSYARTSAFTLPRPCLNPSAYCFIGTHKAVLSMVDQMPWVQSHTMWVARYDLPRLLYPHPRPVSTTPPSSARLTFTPMEPD
jgi:hypothetical protein